MMTITRNRIYSSILAVFLAFTVTFTNVQKANAFVWTVPIAIEFVVLSVATFMVAQGMAKDLVEARFFVNSWSRDELNDIYNDIKDVAGGAWYVGASVIEKIRALYASFYANSDNLTQEVVKDAKTSEGSYIPVLDTAGETSQSVLEAFNPYQFPCKTDEGDNLDFTEFYRTSSLTDYHFTKNGSNWTINSPTNPYIFHINGVEFKVSKIDTIYTGTPDQKPYWLPVTGGTMQIFSYNAITKQWTAQNTLADAITTNVMLITPQQVISQTELSEKLNGADGVTVPAETIKSIQDYANGTTSVAPALALKDGVLVDTTTQTGTTTTTTTETGFWSTVVGWLEGFWDAFINAMKTLFIPRSGFVIDRFIQIKNNAIDKFPNNLDLMNALKTDAEGFSDITINTGNLKLWNNTNGGGQTVVIVSAKTVNDNIGTIRRLTSILWGLLLGIYVYNQLYFLIRGTYPIKMGVSRKGEGD